jgi:hypothetical protein
VIELEHLPAEGFLLWDPAAGAWKQADSSRVLTLALLALKDFDPENDPMPTEFGRHSTVHRAHPQHYTTANAVMLAVSFLREAQQSGW